MNPISIFNPWVILAAVAVLFATGFGCYYTGKSDGKAIVYAEWEKANAAKTDAKLDVKGKQDAIQNAPVDVSITARRLRGGSF